MSFCNLKKKLNHIGSILKTKIDNETLKVKKIEKKINSSILNNGYENYLTILNSQNLNSEDNNWKIPKPKLMSDKTLIVFVYDIFSPFLGEKIDKYSPKLALLKKQLEIENTESWGQVRAEECFSPWEKYIPPRVNGEDKKRDIGQYVHIVDREKCHIGFLNVMAQCALSIEANQISQFRLENTYNPTETKNKERSYIAQAIMNDTVHNRLINTEKALSHFLTTVMAFTTSRNRSYDDIYFITNPICPTSNPDVPLIGKLIVCTLGNILKQGIALYIPSRVSVVTLNDLYHVDESAYIPKKKIAREMKSLVIVD